jgi:hypothetical protein
MSGPDSPEDPRGYVRAVIDAYVRLPATPVRARREDRRLAAELHARGVPFEVVESALLLGVVRKARPPTEAPPQTTIRSLHYFLPLVEEIMRDPPPAPYIDYLREIVADWLPKTSPTHEGLDRQGTARVQKSTLLDER